MLFTDVFVILAGMIPFFFSRIFCLGIFTLVLQLPVAAFVLPASGSQLTQTQVMFEWNEVRGADRYEITIWQINKETHQRQQVLSQKSPYIACLVNQSLLFGNTYEWQVRAFHLQKLLSTSDFYAFEILTSAQVMPDRFRTDIRFNKTPGTNLIFLDHSAMAIDMKGKPVWFLPIPTDSLAKWVIRDLQLTPFGTVTCLDAYGAYEKSLDGKLLWKGPDDGKVSGGATEGYHHDLKKHNDGSFTVCGSAFKTGKDGVVPDASTALRYNTVIHYNTDGSIGWKWDERMALKNDSFFKKFATERAGGHLNGFAFANTGERIYLSFKNYYDVCLLDIASGKFTGSLKKTGSVNAASFQQQHGPFVTKENEVLIYNNNLPDEKDQDQKEIRNPSIMLFSYDSVLNKSQVKWSYTVRAENYPQGISGKEGYVSETPAGTYLVCTGGANYAAEITKDKQKIWECYFYERTAKDTTWKPYTNYRCQVATSLYPLYYTLQFEGIKNGQVHFRLYNAGTEPGLFKLVFSNSKGIIRQAQYSRTLQPGESQLFAIPTTAENIKEVFCIIAPLHVSGVQRQYNFHRLQ